MSENSYFRSAAVLQVRDIVASRAFYIDKLGFEHGNLWGEPPCFCIVGRDTVTLFLDEARDKTPLPVNQWWAAYIYVEDADQLYEALKQKGVPMASGIEDAPYGCRDFTVIDPDGHRIAFGQDLHPSEAGPGL